MSKPRKRNGIQQVLAARGDLSTRKIHKRLYFDSINSGKCSVGAHSAWQTRLGSHRCVAQSPSDCGFEQENHDLVVELEKQKKKQRKVTFCVRFKFN